MAEVKTASCLSTKLLIYLPQHGNELTHTHRHMSND